MIALYAYLPAMLAALVLISLERLRSAPVTDWRRNLEAWGLNILVALILLPLFHRWAGPALVDGTKLPFWSGFLIFLLVQDCGEYLFHRAQHAIPALWAMHALHHSDPEMSTLTTERHFWADQLLKQVTVYSAALMVIAPTPAMVIAYGFASLWNYVSHSNLPIDLGRWSWLINTPAYHRRHHSALPEHYDQNFAAIFPIFDVLCRSYRRPDGTPPTGMDRAPAHLGEMMIWPLLWKRVRKEEEMRASSPSRSPDWVA